MSDLVRFGISLERRLLAKFDRLVGDKGYANRSQAIRDLIRKSLVRREWDAAAEVAGTITLVYDHHGHDTVNMLTDIQHDLGHCIVSTQHIHLDHHNCLEVVVVRGRPKEAENLADRLETVKGVKHCVLTMATTGREVP